MIADIHEEFCHLFQTMYFSEAVAAAKKVEKIHRVSKSTVSIQSIGEPNKHPEKRNFVQG